MSANLPPRALVSWTATAYGANFASYQVYRRPARHPVVPWSKIAVIGVPTGYTPATVEQQHTSFLDYEAGWSVSGGQWSAGWDYGVTVTNAGTGLETPVTPNVSGVQLTPDTGYWAVSNLAPWLNFPIVSMSAWDTVNDQSVIWTGRAAGRDLALVRVAAELPARTADLSISDYNRLGEDPLRTFRAAVSSGATMTVHTPRGDRIIGGLYPPSKVTHDATGVVKYTAKMLETVRDPNYVQAGFNLPCGVKLNGSSMFLNAPASQASLIPGSNPFTVLLSGAFVNGAVQDYLSNGAQATTVGYFLMHDPATDTNNLKVRIKGATANAVLDSNNATYFDGNDHCVIFTSSGTAQQLIVDGVVVATSNTTTGAVSPASSFCVGADQAGAANFSAITPKVWGYWPRVFTAAEIAAATGDALLYPAYRMPPGSAYFVDLRDARTWNGVSGSTITDLSGNAITTTPSGTPPTKGVPFASSILDKV